MPPIGREEFREAVHGLDPGDLARFVADLYRARGATVERSGTRLEVTGNDRTREVTVRHPDTDTGDELDVDGAGAGAGDGVVDDGPADEGEVVDTVDIHRILLYGVDRSTCSALVERHLDRPLSSFAGDDDRPPSGAGMATEEGPSPVRSERVEPGGGGSVSVAPTTRRGDAGNAGTAPAASGSSGVRQVASVAGSVAGRRVRRRPLVVVAVLALVLTGGVTGALVVGVPGGGGPVTGDDGTPEPNPEGAAPDGGTAPTTDAITTDAPESDSGTDRPGENGAGAGASTDRGRDGVSTGTNASEGIDEVHVAETTVAFLSNRSYRLSFVVREFVDGRPSAARHEVIRVENTTTYTASITRSGEFSITPPRLAREDVYANGTVRLVRGPDGSVREEPLGTDPDGPYADVLDRYLRWYLSVSSSTVVDVTADDEVPAVWLILEGDPYPGVVNTTGSARIDQRGVAREVYRSYGVPDRPRVRVEVTLRVEDVTETDVTPPDWAVRTRPR